MSESKHTPIPWRVEAGDDYYIEADGYPKDAPPVVDNNLDDGVLVALVGNQTKDCGEANARFIVRAVNSHEALVEALRPFANTPTHHFEQGHAGVASDCPVCGPILRAMNALALAEKES